jgi:4-amino-4-deoxy-L-arabinose transferase-like glycosyltransferase
MDTTAGTQLKLTDLLAIGWAMGLTLVYLARDNGLLLLVQFGQLAAASLQTTRVGPYFGIFLLGRIADGVCVAALFASAFAMGAVATARLLPDRTPLGALFALGVGLWIMAVGVLVIGAFSVPKVPLMFCGLIAWALPAPRKLLGSSLRSDESLDAWGKAMLVCLIGAALLNLPGALVPPFEYDELEYHLGAPAEYIRAGHIGFLPHNFYSNMPQLTEMLYLLGLVTTSDGAAKLLHWMFGVFAAVTVYSVATSLWTRKVGITAAALFYCTPFVQDLSQTGRVDLATTFFAALAFGGLLSWKREEVNRYLWLSALATGAAVATKWPAVGIALLPALGFVFLARRSWRLTLCYGLVAGVAVAPWLVKNWVLAGNPVYPLLYGLFPSPHWSAAQAALFAQRHSPTFDGDGIVQVVGRIWQFSFTEPGAVPLLLMAAPLVLLIRKRDPGACRAAGLFLASYAGWYLLTFRPWRFLLPAFPLAAMVGAYALESVSFGKRASVVLRIAIGVVMMFSLARMAMSNLVDVEDYRRVPPMMNPIQYSLGQVSREEFVSRMGGGLFEPVVWMNHNLPAAARVLYLGEARVYYEKFPVLWSTAFDQHPLAALVSKSANSEELRALIRARGITHVYVNQYELTRLSRNYGYLNGLNWAIVEDLLNRHARVIHEHGPYVVYALES